MGKRHLLLWHVCAAICSNDIWFDDIGSIPCVQNKNLTIFVVTFVSAKFVSTKFVSTEFVSTEFVSIEFVVKFV